MTTPSTSLPDASPFSMFFQSVFIINHFYYKKPEIQELLYFYYLWELLLQLLPNFNVVPERRPNAAAFAANQAAAAAAAAPAPIADRQNREGGAAAGAGANANVAEWDANVAEWDAHELGLYDDVDNGTLRFKTFLKNLLIKID